MRIPNGGDVRAGGEKKCINKNRNTGPHYTLLHRGPVCIAFNFIYCTARVMYGRAAFGDLYRARGRNPTFGITLIYYANNPVVSMQRMCFCGEETCGGQKLLPTVVLHRIRYLNTTSVLKFGFWHNQTQPATQR